MISGAVFCPQAPVLVPEVAQGAAAELDGLRAACHTAICRVAAPQRHWIVIGSGSEWAFHEPNARGTLAGFGVALEVSLGSDDPGPVELPVSVTVGAWLLRDVLGAGSGATGYTVGRREADRPDPLVPDDEGDYAVLVLGDGSARRSTKAPGYLDPRAERFDADIADALRGGDAGRLRVDRGLGEELLAAGVRAWDAAARSLEALEWDAELLYDEAPYGVGYLVAAWTARRG